MEFEAFGKTFRFGKKPAEPEAPPTEEDLAAEIENFEFVADIATINAIPNEVIRKYRVRGVAKRQGLLLASVVAAFALIWVGSTTFLSFQDNRVAELNEERDLLRQESDSLSPYQQYKQALDNKRSVLANSTQTDINYGQMYDILITTANSSNVALKTVDISQFSEEGETGACISPDPLNQTTGIIGCVSLTASTPNETQLVEFLAGLESNTEVTNGFTLPSVASFTNDGSGEQSPSVNMSIFFTQNFYSSKYSDLSTPIEELIAAGMVQAGEENDEEEPEMTFEDQMTAIAFQVSDELGIEGTIDNLGMVTDVATEMCTAGEVIETETQAGMIAELTEGITSEDIILAVGEKC